MDMDEVLKKLFDEKTVRILNEVQGTNKIIRIRETARKTKLPVATVYRIFKKLVEADLLKMGKIANLSYYEINKSSKAYLLVEKMLPKLKPVEAFTALILKEKIEEVLLLDEGEERASIMVIGEVKSNRAFEITEQIKNDYGFLIKSLVLSRPQYENLDALNMKPVPKKVLFKR
jgi:DNA-binding Lrp family transcriptional regulator